MAFLLICRPEACTTREVRRNDMEAKDAEKKEPAKKRVPIAIPLRVVPNDKAEMESELESLFDEDKVVHRQGNSEPEAD